MAIIGIDVRFFIAECHGMIHGFRAERGCWVGDQGVAAQEFFGETRLESRGRDRSREIPTWDRNSRRSRVRNLRLNEVLE
jgi:hypothetical protein